MTRTNIIREVERYYSNKINRYGPVPMGVDWNGSESQRLRFDQLFNLIDLSLDRPTVLDYGCGYGALFPYLSDRVKNLNYVGFDISSSMIAAAEKYNAGKVRARWVTDGTDLPKSDYVVASGLFNVMNQVPVEEWQEYTFETLTKINELSIKGFAFNMLTAYSDADKMKSDLFYANPSAVFEFCKLQFSKSVALLHDYALYEFTIIVRKGLL